MALCTLAEVKEALEIPGSDTSRDDTLEAMIGDASKVIARDCRREFEDAGTVARLFGWSGLRTLDLDPYDLRSVTSVVVSPGEDTETTLVEDTDFVTLPVTAEHGVYTRLRFSSSLTLDASDFTSDFGFARLQVTGEWGFASVPDDVKRAAILTVSSWAEKSISAYAADGWDEPRGTIPRPSPNFAIPGAAWRLLSPFARRQVF